VFFILKEVVFEYYLTGSYKKSTNMSPPYAQ